MPVIFYKWIIETSTSPSRNKVLKSLLTLQSQIEVCSVNSSVYLHLCAWVKKESKFSHCMVLRIVRENTKFGRFEILVLVKRTNHQQRRLQWTWKHSTNGTIFLGTIPPLQMRVYPRSMIHHQKLQLTLLERKLKAKGQYQKNPIRMKFWFFKVQQAR